MPNQSQILFFWELDFSVEPFVPAHTKHVVLDSCLVMTLAVHFVLAIKVSVHNSIANVVVGKSLIIYQNETVKSAKDTIVKE